MAKSFVLPVFMLRLVLLVNTTVPAEFTILSVHLTLVLLLPVPVSAKCTLALVDVPTVVGLGLIEFSVMLNSLCAKAGAANPQIATASNKTATLSGRAGRAQR
jgi:hypothetical protein